MRFRAVVESNGKTATGIEVPASVVEELGGGKRAKVTVALGDHVYRSSVASMGGRFLIPVSAEVRAAAGVAAGDEVDVGLELDVAPREVEVPDDLAAALDADAAARQCFDGLSYSDRRAIVMNVEGTKNPDTRLRRITTAVARLHDGRAR
jgi:Domain of unknown function (DUF1905)/Bacteriocin-protection, YdeI or OmpD-Associated